MWVDHVQGLHREVLPLKVISWNFKIVLEKGKEHVPKTTTFKSFCS
jgi:hypothetical protein